MNPFVQVNSQYADAAVIVKARLERVEMQMLDKLVEGLGHLGIVTTTNKAIGEVMIQTTKQCWPDLKKAIKNMPFKIEFIDANIDLIIKARLDRSEIQMLCKLVEGLGHLGIVTTTNKELGEVMIQTTQDCWPELKRVIGKMPIRIDFI